MLGIGLGGFMEGFNNSQRMKLEKEKAALAKERYDRQKVLDQREDAAYERAESQRKAIEDTVKTSQANFQAAVDAGTAEPEDSDEWFSKNTVPLLKSTYLLNGDIDNADRVQKWADTADAKAGAKLFKSAMLKAQTGDGVGALDDAIKAGQTQGYIAHGYEVQKHDQIVKPDGTLVGYRVWLTDPDGKEIQQDILAAELPKTIATFLNPEAAWESQIAASQAEKKRADELTDYRAKKVIDKEVGLGDDKLRGNAITALRKRMDGGLTGDEPKFDDLPADQKEKAIAEEIQLQRGGPAAANAPGLGGPAAATSAPAAAGRKVVVDTVTGRAVPSKPDQGLKKPAPAATEPRRPAPAEEISPYAAPGALDQAERRLESAARRPAIDTQDERPRGPDRKPAQDYPRPMRQVGIASKGSDWSKYTARSENAPVEKEKPKRSPSRKDVVAEAIMGADAAVRDGVPVDRVVHELLANGIPEEQWPALVKQAIANRRGGAVVGLGR